MLEKIELEIGVEDAFLIYMLQGRKIEFIPRNIYDKIYNYLVQEGRIEDKNKIFSYKDKIVDKTVDEILREYNQGSGG